MDKWMSFSRMLFRIFCSGKRVPDAWFGHSVKEDNLAIYFDFHERVDSKWLSSVYNMNKKDREIP
jgi:hypothetical protein